MKIHQGEWKWKFNSTKRVPNNAISPNLEILESFKLYVPLLKETNSLNILNPNASKIIVFAMKLVSIKVFGYYMWAMDYNSTNC
jgi:hypothetical protein